MMNTEIEQARLGYESSTRHKFVILAKVSRAERRLEKLKAELREAQNNCAEDAAEWMELLAASENGNASKEI